MELYIASYCEICHLSHAPSCCLHVPFRQELLEKDRHLRESRLLLDKEQEEVETLRREQDRISQKRDAEGRTYQRNISDLQDCIQMQAQDLQKAHEKFQEDYECLRLERQESRRAHFQKEKDQDIAASRLKAEIEQLQIQNEQAEGQIQALQERTEQILHEKDQLARTLQLSIANLEEQLKHRERTMEQCLRDCQSSHRTTVQELVREHTERLRDAQRKLSDSEKRATHGEWLLAASTSEVENLQKRLQQCDFELQTALKDQMSTQQQLRDYEQQILFLQQQQNTQVNVGTASLSVSTTPAGQSCALPVSAYMTPTEEGARQELPISKETLGQEQSVLPFTHGGIETTAQHKQAFVESRSGLALPMGVQMEPQNRALHEERNASRSAEKPVDRTRQGTVFFRLDSSDTGSALVDVPSQTTDFFTSTSPLTSMNSASWKQTAGFSFGVPNSPDVRIAEVLSGLERLADSTGKGSTKGVPGEGLREHSLLDSTVPCRPERNDLLTSQSDRRAEEETISERLHPPPPTEHTGREQAPLYKASRDNVVCPDLGHKEGSEVSGALKRYDASTTPARMQPTSHILPKFGANSLHPAPFHPEIQSLATSFDSQRTADLSLQQAAESEFALNTCAEIVSKQANSNENGEIDSAMDESDAASETTHRDASAADHLSLQQGVVVLNELPRRNTRSCREAQSPAETESNLINQIQMRQGPLPSSRDVQANTKGVAWMTVSSLPTKSAMSDSSSSLSDGYVQLNQFGGCRRYQWLLLHIGSIHRQFCYILALICHCSALLY